MKLVFLPEKNSSGWLEIGIFPAEKFWMSFLDKPNNIDLYIENLALATKVQ